MPRRCRLCAHPLRKEIDKYISAGHSWKEFCRKFKARNISVFAYSRHKSHLTERVAADQSDVITTVDQASIRKINRKLQILAKRCETRGQTGPAVQAYARIAQNLELLNRLPPPDIDAKTRTEQLIALIEKQGAAAVENFLNVVRGHFPELITEKTYLVFVDAPHRDSPDSVCIEQGKVMAIQIGADNDR